MTPYTGRSLRCKKRASWTQNAWGKCGLQHVILHLCSMELCNENANLKEVLEKVFPGAETVVFFSFNRGLILEYPLNFRYLFGKSKLFTLNTTNRDVNMWVLSSSDGDFVDCPMDMDESAMFLHNCNFTLDPNSPPFNLSELVIKTPGASAAEVPEKLVMCTKYLQYSTASPVMTKIVMQRDLAVSRVMTYDSREIANVWGSENLYLVQTPNCMDAILHAFPIAAVDTYRNIGNKWEEKTRLVKLHKKMLVQKMEQQNVSIPHVCKGVHIEPLPELELFIFNVVQRGNVTAVSVPAGMTQEHVTPFFE